MTVQRRGWSVHPANQAEVTFYDKYQMARVHDPRHRHDSRTLF
jgi:hypothetical protein